MSVYIHRIETAVPGMSYDQEFASEVMQRYVSNDERTRRIIKNIYSRSGIRKRHSVLSDYSNGAGDPLFFDRNGNPLPVPGTRVRNEYYTREARLLFSRLAERLIQNSGMDKSAITHVITISCTGFFAPGPDFYVVRDLGLDGSVERFHVGFMGCYAAFQGLKMANAICRSDPDAVVLVLSVELCSLHLKFTDDPDNIIAASVFADGGSGALVSARTPSGSVKHKRSDATTGYGMNPGKPDRTQAPFEILSFFSDLAVEGEKDMAWTIGNEGFEMKLSTYVPEIIRSHIGPVLDTILQKAGLARAEIDQWAIHPGGRAILDNIRNALQIPEERITASREVLAEYGNMSSATIFFVLKRLAEEQWRAVGIEEAEVEAEAKAEAASEARAGSEAEVESKTKVEVVAEAVAGAKAKTKGESVTGTEVTPAQGPTVFAMAFGPGLTIESGLFAFAESYDTTTRS